MTDWDTDYDIFSEEYLADPASVWAELRGEGCPVAHTERHGGSFLPVNWEDISAVVYDVDHFSSVDVGVTPPAPGSSLLFTPPITSDPPFHTKARRLLLPSFSPKAIDALEAGTRALARELIAALDGRDEADAAADYAQHIPVRVISRMLGIPEEEEDRFTGWTVSIIQEGRDPEVRRTASREVIAYFAEQIERRREEPGDDMITALLDARLDDAPLTEKHIIGSCFLLLIAGIDTTWSSIGSSLWHLATHHDDRDRLVAEPDLIPTAIEEFLRAYAPVTMARQVTSDTEISGCPVHAGDKVLLAFPAGNRDPEQFDRPDEVIIDRERNRHFAFGLGIHRCLGSNLARMELRVAVEEWLAAFPGYTLTPGGTVTWAGGQVRGPRAVPVTLR